MSISLCFLDHLNDFTDKCFVKANSSDAKKQKTSTSVAPASSTSSTSKGLFTKSSRAIIWGLQTRAVQGMMDFDYVCGRSEPSVAAMVYPMAPGDSKQNFYWGHKEVLIPVYKSMADAMAAFPEVDVMVSFASLSRGQVLVLSGSWRQEVRIYSQQDKSNLPSVRLPR